MRLKITDNAIKSATSVTSCVHVLLLGLIARHESVVRKSNTVTLLPNYHS